MGRSLESGSSSPEGQKPVERVIFESSENTGEPKKVGRKPLLSQLFESYEPGRTKELVESLGLTERQLQVVKFRLGFDGEKRTQAETANEVGTSRENVKNVEKAVTEKLLATHPELKEKLPKKPIKLTPMEERVLGEQERSTNAQIGRDLGVTREDIRQIGKRGREKLERQIDTHD